MHQCNERNIGDLQSFFLPSFYSGFQGLHLLFQTYFPLLLIFLQVNSLLPVPYINSMLSNLSLLTFFLTLKILIPERRCLSHNASPLPSTLHLWELLTVRPLHRTSQPQWPSWFLEHKLTPPQGPRPCLSLFLPGQQNSTLVFAEVIPLPFLTAQIIYHLLSINSDHHSIQGVLSMSQNNQDKRIKITCSAYVWQRDTV